MARIRATIQILAMTPAAAVLAVTIMLIGVVPADTASAAGTTGTSTDLPVPASDLSTPVPFTVVANEDITNRDLRAIRLANYAQVRTDGTVITGLDVTDAGYAAQIAAAITDAGIDTSDSDPVAYDPANPMPWVMAHLLQASTAPWNDATPPNLRAFLTSLRRQFITTEPTLPGTSTTLSTPTGGDAQTDGRTKTADVVPGVYLVLDWTGANNPADNGSSDRASIPMLNGTGVSYTPADGTATVLDTLVGAGGAGTTYTLGTVEYKAAGIAVTKTVEGGSSADVQIGDTLSFALVTTIPNYTGYDRFQFRLADTMAPGLTFDDVTSVTVGGKDLTASENIAWTLVRDPQDPKVAADGATFEVVFAPDSGNGGLSDLVTQSGTFPVGAEVDVTYTATLNRDATVMGGGNANGAEALYSHNPNETTDVESAPADPVAVYTGAITLAKTDMSGDPLVGAEFTITRKGDDAPVPLVDLTGGTYRVADAGELSDGTPTVAAMVTPDAGTLTVNGLQGAYTITETRSPFDNPLLPSFTVEVGTGPASAPDGGTGTVQGAARTVVGQPTGDLYGLVSLDTSAGATNALAVRNARNLMEMPKTGAAWLSVYAVGALLFTAGGLPLLAMTRRRRAR